MTQLVSCIHDTAGVMVLSLWLPKRVLLEDIFFVMVAAKKRVLLEDIFFVMVAAKYGNVP